MAVHKARILALRREPVKMTADPKNAEKTETHRMSSHAPLAPVILASGSPHRKRLLQQLGIKFDVLAPDIDERRVEGESGRDYVARLSRQKAEAVGDRHPGAVIIGSDQTAVLGKDLVGKPGDHPTAVRQLLAASGRCLQFLTGLCVLDTRTTGHTIDIATVEAQFRPLDEATVERYLQLEPAYDCAGSFRSEGLGVSLLDAMRGDDPTALVGLPLIRLGARLRALGYPVP